LILCEDTRQTKKLLAHFSLSTPTLSYHQHSDFKKTEQILDLLSQGKKLALVSDAGTPGISDPGNRLVQLISQRLPRVRIIPIPGPSAVIAALSVSGFACDKFLFLGFPPKKRKRNQFFAQIKQSVYPVVFYQSPHRISKTLQTLKEVIPQREIMVGRELSKKFETIYRGTAEEVINQLKESIIKGEFVIVIDRP